MMLVHGSTYTMQELQIQLLSMNLSNHPIQYHKLFPESMLDHHDQIKDLSPHAHLLHCQIIPSLPPPLSHNILSTPNSTLKYSTSCTMSPPTNIYKWRLICGRLSRREDGTTLLSLLSDGDTGQTFIGDDGDGGETLIPKQPALISIAI